MENAIQLDADRFRSVYEYGYQEWHRLLSRVKDFGPLRSSTQDAFRQQPFFPPNLSLKYDENGVFATGYAVWGSSGTSCNQNLLPFKQLVRFQVTVSGPAWLVISKTTDSTRDCASWFASTDNYIAVLMLAWAYILSARWVEIMPSPCSISYTGSQATHNSATGDQNNHNALFCIDVGNASPEEVRWWAAILAPDHGWQATMELEEKTFLSPWSIRLQSSPEVSISRLLDTPASPLSTPSFSESFGYINSFCLRHNIIDQSYAALAAVLLLPSLGGGNQTLQIPALRFSSPVKSAESLFFHPDYKMHHDQIRQGGYIDKLLTVSCNTMGIRPILLSTFYEPSIECNAVTPWLQGTFAALDSLANDDPSQLGRVLMERAQTNGAAYLWLGSTILGLQSRILQQARRGLIPTHIPSAIWSGTLQSFIQLPIYNIPEASTTITRADECRLLYLAQTGDHTRVPLCQWKPFGETSLDNVDVQVKAHIGCKGHGLQYQDFIWDCTTGEQKSQLAQSIPSSPSLTQKPDRLQQIPISYEALDRSDEIVSANETRKIFTWLRTNGYGKQEKEIFEHEWLVWIDSDEEGVDAGDSAGSPLIVGANCDHLHLSYIDSWLDRVDA